MGVDAGGDFCVFRGRAGNQRSPHRAAVRAFVPAAASRGGAKLIEKHARAAGLGDITVTLSKLGSGAAVNDALLSGSVDIALGGTTVLMTIWDKSKGGRGDIKGMMAFCDTPMVITTIDPRIKSIRDYREGDRIAMTAARGTHHSISLQMAAAKDSAWRTARSSTT